MVSSTALYYTLFFSFVKRKLPLSDFLPRAQGDEDPIVVRVVGHQGEGDDLRRGLAGEVGLPGDLDEVGLLDGDRGPLHDGLALAKENVCRDIPLPSGDVHHPPA